MGAFLLFETYSDRLCITSTFRICPEEIFRHKGQFTVGAIHELPLFLMLRPYI